MPLPLRRMRLKESCYRRDVSRQPNSHAVLIRKLLGLLIPDSYSYSCASFSRDTRISQNLVSQIDNFHEAHADFDNNVFRDEKRGGGMRDTMRHRKRRWRCVIKLRIVRGELIVLAARFSRSQRDNCSIFPLI